MCKVSTTGPSIWRARNTLAGAMITVSAHTTYLSVASVCVHHGSTRSSQGAGCYTVLPSGAFPTGHTRCLVTPAVRQIQTKAQGSPKKYETETGPDASRVLCTLRWKGSSFQAVVQASPGKGAAEQCQPGSRAWIWCWKSRVESQLQNELTFLFLSFFV